MTEFDPKRTFRYVTYKRELRTTKFQFTKTGVGVANYLINGLVNKYPDLEKG